MLDVQWGALFGFNLNVRANGRVGNTVNAPLSIA